jgi:hypothetical protein
MGFANGALLHHHRAAFGGYFCICGMEDSQNTHHAPEVI